MIVAQSVLETGWGESDLAKDSNNLFGIKAFSNKVLIDMQKKMKMLCIEYF